MDALPLLQKAEQVVVEMALDPDFADVYKHLNDVLVWLQRHGVTAGPRVLLSTGDDAGSLDVVAHERDAGVIVAGYLRTQSLARMGAGRHDLQAVTARQPLFISVALRRRLNGDGQDMCGCPRVAAVRQISLPCIETGFQTCLPGWVH